MSIQTRQTGYFGGIADDPRSVRLYRGNFYADAYAITKHFDIFSKPGELVPYRSFEGDMDDGSTPTGMKQYFVRDFLYPTASGRLFGLGQTAAGLTKIVQKADALSGSWSAAVDGIGDGVVQNGCFVEYKDRIWGFQGTNRVFNWGLLSATPVMTNTKATVGTITSVAQGVVARDDNLYLPYNYKLVRATASVVQDAALTLPTNYKINSICNYNNYLAIACAPLATYNGTSKVFLWNLISPDVQEVIDWGEGELRVLETIEGSLVGITDRYLSSSAGAGRGSMIIQTYQGGTPQVVKEIFTQTTVGQVMPLSKTVKNNRVFFSAKIMSNASGTEYNEGIWSFGRKSSAYPSVLSLDYIDENVGQSGIQAFGSAANFFFISYNSDGSIDKTNDAASYTFTSIFESQIFNFGSSGDDKRLDDVKVSMRKLLAGESLTLKYKVDNASVWTTIGTYNTVGGISHTFLREESNDKEFSSGKEFIFRMESTGGLEIIGLAVNATPFIHP
jgi:hypothetical protein